MTDFDEDLIASARRGELDVDDERRFRFLLDSSIEARLLYLAGRALDAEDVVQRGDDMLAERIARRVRTRWAETHVGTRGRRMRRAGLLALAALSLVTLSASAIVGIRRAKLAAIADHAAAFAAMQIAGRGSRSAHRVSALTAELRADPAASAPATDAFPRRVAPSFKEMPTAREPERGTGAAELFADAARARRSGQTDRALALYDALAKNYPGSAEARAGEIARGMLRLDRGPRAALGHFRRYLDENPGGDLASEALWGEALALERIGQRAEAAKTLAQLVARFPDSAYARAAQSKLSSAQE